MIFQVNHSTEHIKKFEDFDAELIPFENSGGINYAIPDFPYDKYTPKVMKFHGHLQQLGQTDFPHTNPTLPLMSMKMLLTCLSVGEFAYQMYPTRIYGLEDDKANETMESFVIVHLTSWTDALDMQNTLLARRDETQPRAVRKYMVYSAAQSKNPENLELLDIEQLHINVPEDSLPGLFRLKQLDGLYCPEKTKRACEQAGIRGVEFSPVPVPLGQGVRPYLLGYRLVTQKELESFRP